MSSWSVSPTTSTSLPEQGDKTAIKFPPATPIYPRIIVYSTGDQSAIVSSMDKIDALHPVKISCEARWEDLAEAERENHQK